MVQLHFVPLELSLPESSEMSDQINNTNLT